MESTKDKFNDDIAVILYGILGEHLEDGRVTEDEIASLIKLLSN